MLEIPKSHIMHDIETLGKGNKACILSIGAVYFFPREEGIMSHFEVFIDPESCVAAGLDISVSTVMWWMDSKRDEARKALVTSPLPRLPLRHALEAYSEFISGDRPVWGNGSTFDNVILRNAFEAVGLKCPWEFWNDRCYRTIKSEYPEVKMIRQGTHHSAAADAVSQAVHLQAIFKSISGEK